MSERDHDFNSIEDPVAASLAQIKYFEQALEALHFAVNAISDRNGNYSSEFDSLHRKIYERLHHAYQQFFMWGNVVGGEVQKKAIKLAHEKFLHDHMGVMNYLQTDGRYPGSHRCDDEEEFRAEVRELGIKKKALDPVVAVVQCPTCFAERGRSCRDKKFKKISPHKQRNIASLKATVHPDPKKR